VQGEISQKKLLCGSASWFVGAEWLSWVLWQNGYFLFRLSWL